MTAQGRLFLAVGLGASLGTLARALTSLVLFDLVGRTFPWDILAINVVGSFVIGLYATLTDPDGRLVAGPAARQFVLVGLCGGYTTFSIFSFETLLLFEQQRYAAAALHVGLSVVLWLLAVWLGYRAGQRLNRLKGTLR